MLRNVNIKAMSNRLDQDREKELQPKRIEYAIKKITDLGYEIEFKSETMLRFNYNDHAVCFYPYSGWHTGKSIKDGRGLQNLLDQLEPKKKYKAK